MASTWAPEFLAFTKSSYLKEKFFFRHNAVCFSGQREFFHLSLRNEIHSFLFIAAWCYWSPMSGNLRHGHNLLSVGNCSGVVTGGNYSRMKFFSVRFCHLPSHYYEENLANLLPYFQSLNFTDDRWLQNTYKLTFPHNEILFLNTKQGRNQQVLLIQ